MRDFRQLQVWQKSHAFVLDLYRDTNSFPKEELYGLKSQLRCAAVSIPSNIAEGCGRKGDAELARFCQIAMGSASEVEYQWLLAGDLNFLRQGEYERLRDRLTEVKRMLNALLQRLR